VRRFRTFRGSYSTAQNQIRRKPHNPRLSVPRGAGAISIVLIFALRV
jgi:hypothetical protein